MRRLSSKALLYLGATILPRVLGILLLPLYSHYLSPAEYGVFGVANTVSMLLSMIMVFGMTSAVSRFYFDSSDDEQRRTIMGQIVIFLVVAPLVILGVLEWKGVQIFHFFTPDVSYSSYLRIVAWTTYFAMFGVVPLMIIRSQEQARMYTLLTVGQAVLYHGLAITLVVRDGWGVRGLIWGNFLTTIVLLPVYVVLVLRMVSLRPSLACLLSLLEYSLPLIPHSMAGWVLNLSDRIILQFSASLSDIGVYSLGYTLGGATQNVADAVNTAWFPSFYRSQTTGVERAETLKLATYMIAIVCGTALLVTIGGHHFVIWFLSKSYAGAERVILWVAMSAVFVIMYYIWSFSIHYTKKTWYLPIVTWIAALANLGLNYFFIPRYGYVAAAVNTFIAYLVMAAICSIIARRLHPVDYEYRRWTILAVVTVIFASFAYFRPVLALTWDLLFSLALLFGWPFALGIGGFYSVQERQLWQNWLRRISRGRLSILHP